MNSDREFPNPKSPYTYMADAWDFNGVQCPCVGGCLCNLISAAGCRPFGKKATVWGSGERPYVYSCLDRALCLLTSGC